MNTNPKPPKRKKGDVKGWSPHSKRRMSDFLVSHELAAGMKPFSVTLTIPPLAKGNPRVVADLAECKRIWKQFVDVSIRRGLAFIWRMEIQPRIKTTRADIRGKEQPHWHLIGGSPDHTGIDKLESDWLASLRDRANVKGAKTSAVNMDFIDGWTEGKKRYLLEHTTKKKAAQVACGWGRHWGVVGRKSFIEIKGETVALSANEALIYARWARQYLARRVPDKRAFGGVNWDKLQIEKRGAAGCNVEWLGGAVWVAGWDGSLPPPPAVCRVVCRALGKARKNIWATKKSNRRGGLPVVQWGGGCADLVKAVRSYCAGADQG